jgi:hypothetical protein
MKMKLRFIIVWLSCTLVILSCTNRSGNDKASSITFVNREADKAIDVMIDGKLFTSFCWPENVYKPVLYPVYTSAGTEITRGFPLKPRKGERNDHMHHIGIWFNYGDVNGFDFWNNGNGGKKIPKGGEIKHLRIDRLRSKKGEGSIVSSESWIDTAGRELLTEKTEYHFIANGETRIIDRITTLTSGDSAVHFNDIKEGLFAIRVARQLELPSKERVVLTDSLGNESPVRDTLNTGVTGNYISSEGITGDAVWGTRAKWMELTGTIGAEKISVVICDHPKNPGYPTYWHARGYGLFAANPFGWKDFTNGKEIFNFSLPAKKPVTFRYRLIVHSGSRLTDSEINGYSDDFAKKYKNIK